VFLGYSAGSAETGSNKLYIDSSSTSSPLIGGDFSARTLTSGTADAGNQIVDASQFFYKVAAATGITSAATDPFGVSANLTLNNVYEFEYWIPMANSSTGTVTMGWAGLAATAFYADVEVWTAGTNGTSIVGMNQFNSTANKAITGLATAASFVVRIRGFIHKGTATARIPIQFSVASGTITMGAGAWFKYTNRGISTSGTTNITYGNIA
jgi:hypothetical protein